MTLVCTHPTPFPYVPEFYISPRKHPTLRHPVTLNLPLFPSQAPPPASHQEGTSGATVALDPSSPPVPKRSPPKAQSPAAAAPGVLLPGSGRRTPSKGGTATPPLKKGSPPQGGSVVRTSTPSPTPKKGSPIGGGTPGRKPGPGGAEPTSPAPQGSEVMSPPGRTGVSTVPGEISSPELIACKATVDAVQAQWDSYVLARGQEWGLEALPPRIRAELSSFMVHALSELGQSVKEPPPNPKP